MEIQKAQDFAQDFVELQLGDNGWVFMWDLSLEHFGTTQFERKIVTLSKVFTAINNEYAVLDTLRHEVAHAKNNCPHNDPHDDCWRDIFISIGGTGKRHIDRNFINVPVLVDNPLH
jgi:predicted SprT family Zn-dependent metalloprotease